MGCVHLYCGDGKGKTTAAIGLTIRAAGTGKRVVVARFLKTDQSGEVEILKRLPEVTIIPCEKTFGFTWNMTNEVKREAADYYKRVFETACREAVKRCEEAGNLSSAKLQNKENVPEISTLEGECTVDMEAKENGSKAPEENCFCETCDVLLVLDEVCASLSSGLLELADIVDFLDHRPANLEIVMTGRKPPEELLLRADYVTEMQKIKHPFDAKILARRGIEY